MLFVLNLQTSHAGENSASTFSRSSLVIHTHLCVIQSMQVTLRLLGLFFEIHCESLILSTVPPRRTNQLRARLSTLTLAPLCRLAPAGPLPHTTWTSGMSSTSRRIKRSSGWYRWPPLSLQSLMISFDDCRVRMHPVVRMRRIVPAIVSLESCELTETVE